MGNLRNRFMLAAAGTVLLSSILGGGGAHAADQPAAGAFQVKEFRFLDKELDRISLEKAGEPDGTRDGHLSLLLDAGSGLVIKSIVMKTADAQGNDTGHGVWKTWKPPGEIGSYLLAVVQDGKPMNTTFQETLGSFKGIVQLELYASDNNGMKPGEYYYLEIVTDKGTVKSGIAPYAENEVSYAPIAIREFSSVDLNSDQFSIAYHGADGRMDGHFKLKLTFAQKTEVLSVILRPTDKDGKPAYQGIWRTNQAGIGWLLGIMQGETVVTPEFKKDVKEPVGSFRGTVVFDLYANNNGSIKDGNYYVAEVETPFGTVISKPIQFGNPSTNYVNNSPLGFKIIAMNLDSKTAVVDEQEHQLEVAPFTLEGRTMVPIRFIGEALGAKVDWNGQDRRVTLVKDGIKVELVIDEKNAYVNGALQVLDSPAVIRDGITLVPVRFVSESMKMKVFFEDGEIVITDAKERSAAK